MKNEIQYKILLIISITSAPGTACEPTISFECQFEVATSKIENDLEI